MGGYMAWRPAPDPRAGQVHVFMPPLAVLEHSRAQLRVGEASPRTVLDAIVAGVAEAAAVPVPLLLGDRKAVWIVEARMAAYAAARRVGAVLAGRGAPALANRSGRRVATILSYPAIAERMGGRDHTTVISGVRTCEARIAAGDRALLAVVQAGVAAGLRFHRHRAQGRAGLRQAVMS